jgi:hypothetical protein
LNLGGKNYENLVEAFTNNAINAAATSSSSPRLSLPSSSFLGPSNQSDNFRKEEPKCNHHNKDIAD